MYKIVYIYTGCKYNLFDRRGDNIILMMLFNDKYRVQSCPGTAKALIFSVTSYQ